MSEQVTISVVIPLFQGEPFIDACLKSVLEQTELPNEILVINDGSSDQGPALARKWSAKSPIPLRVIDQKNQGLAGARNTGIQNAQFDWIAFLDCDDLWHPSKLAEQKRTLSKAKNPNEIGLIYSAYLDRNPDGKESPGAISPFIRKKNSHYLITANFISGSGSAALVRKKALIDVGGFDTTLRSCEDWDMWLRLNEKYAFDFCDKPLVSILSRPGSLSKHKTRMHITKSQLLAKNSFRNLIQVRRLFWTHLQNAPSIVAFSKGVQEWQRNHAPPEKFSLSSQVLIFVFWIGTMMRKVVRYVRRILMKTSRSHA